MSEDQLDRSELLALTSEIVSSHVSNNAVSQPDLTKMIETVFAPLEGLSGPKEEPVDAVSLPHSCQSQDSSSRKTETT